MGQIDVRILQTLVECPLFRGLDTADLADLLSGVRYQLRSYSRNDLVARAGDEVHFQHVVLEGNVKGEMVDYAGKVIKIEDIRPPRPLASAFLFGNHNRYPVHITATEPTRLISFPRDEMLGMMQRNKICLRNFVSAISSRGQFLSNKIRFLSFSTIKGKLAQLLLDLVRKEEGDRVMLPYSQSQLAELFGVARPSVGRAISELNQEGIIRTEGREVVVLDKGRLSMLLE